VGSVFFEQAMQILSHRGCHLGTDIPENTQAAFERAIASGVDGIETDIRLSADSQPILFHDRLASDDRPVDLLTRRELEEVSGYVIPTLDEILSRWPAVVWNLEIKCRAAMPVAIELLKRHHNRERFLMTSFRHDVVARCATELDVFCGLIVAHVPLDVSQMLAPWRALARVRTIVWDFNVLDAGIVGQAKSCGFAVYAYGVETAAEHALCREWGLDAVITDFPDLARGGLPA
jgi:glycerophosphoryl diester phosphodiesterase